MQNIFIEFLPPWVETGLQPAFYDKESGTILQQVSRMYYKINELIESNNDLRTKFIALKEYVDNYLDTVDFEALIDAKLDEMADDGTLAEIIADYATIPELTSRVTALEDDFEDLTHEEYIIMGDSYGASDNSWIDRLISMIGDRATCHKIALGGLGFYHQSSIGTYTFKTYLQDRASTIENPEKINKIIVCGGYNDYDETVSDVQTAISSFCEYCHQTYPNAQVYIGMIGFNTAFTETGADVRNKLSKVTLTAYAWNENLSYAPIFIENSDKIMKNVNLTNADHVHPNSTGQDYIAKAIYNWWAGGNIQSGASTKFITMDNTSGRIVTIRDNNTVRLTITGALVFSFSDAIEIPSGFGADGITEIGDFTADNVFPSSDNECMVNVLATIVDDGTTYRNLPMKFGLNSEGKVIVHNCLTDGSTARSFTDVTYLRIEQPFVLEVSARYN